MVFRTNSVGSRKTNAKPPYFFAFPKGNCRYQISAYENFAMPIVSEITRALVWLDAGMGNITLS